MAEAIVIAFSVVGEPVMQGNKRAFRAGDRLVVVERKGQRLNDWRTLVGFTARQYAPEQPLEGALRVKMRFRLPVPKSAPKTRRLHAIKRPDLDKLTRAVGDALTGVLWRDDSQIVVLEVSKELAYAEPIGVSIAVHELEASA
jgi:crossover junction endodeoxyribonuclease RusA